jgi:hypothetical protein
MCPLEASGDGTSRRFIPSRKTNEKNRPGTLLVLKRLGFLRVPFMEFSSPVQAFAENGRTFMKGFKSNIIHESDRFLQVFASGSSGAQCTD